MVRVVRVERRYGSHTLHVENRDNTFDNMQPSACTRYTSENNWRSLVCKDRDLDTSLVRETLPQILNILLQGLIGAMILTLTDFVWRVDNIPDKISTHPSLCHFAHIIEIPWSIVIVAILWAIGHAT
ncbi:hypothetical protein F5B19DRAFT_460548 [Rostrohypoxylon terebratum]|nr:hypothetical protein F5B19DRAFT_460548 [Rostrohypoxylon terebratum]